jgi:hypothetical protein
MEDDMSVEMTLEMRPSGRNEGPTEVVVDEYSKSSSCDDGKEHDEQVEDRLMTIEKVIKIFR